MRGEGGSFGVSANEHSCAHHVTWSPNKLWRSVSIFNLCFHPCQFVTPFSLLYLSSRLQYYHVHISLFIVITFAFNIKIVYIVLKPEINYLCLCLCLSPFSFIPHLYISPLHLLLSSSLFNPLFVPFPS
jgi:hypothetical protein